jgi:signal transduction histidine kinase
VELSYDYFDFVPLVEIVINQHKTSAAKKGLGLIFDSSVHPLRVYGDSDKIIQVVVNLVSNAIRYTEKGKIMVAIKDLGDKVECVVEDTGRGIAPHDLRRIFSKFEQFGRIPGSGE